VLLVVVAVLLVRQSDLGKPPPPPNPTLAVLPFVNLAADPAQQYFSDGLAEEMLDRLGQVPGLLVVARSSSFAFRDSKDDVREIAAQLGVNVVLEGAVRRDGKRLRLSAKLVDGKTGLQLWSGFEIRRRGGDDDDFLDAVGLEGGLRGRRIPVDEKREEASAGFPARRGDDAEIGFLDAFFAALDQNTDVGHAFSPLYLRSGALKGAPTSTWRL
jgi:TolB-like protein